MFVSQAVDVLAQCFLIWWMVHPRVNKIFAGVNQPKGVNKGETSGDQTEVMQERKTIVLSVSRRV